MTGVQPRIVGGDPWQVSHNVVVSGWLGSFPAATVPLWQLAHVPDISLWSTDDRGVNVVVKWHLSQKFVVAMWVVGLLIIRVDAPLWQSKQAPTTSVCGIGLLKGIQPDVR